MVIDSSALLAILFGEPEADAFIEALAAPDRKFMSAMNKLEAMIVVEARKGASGASSLIKLLAAAGFVLGWKSILFVLALGSVLASIVALSQMKRKNLTGKSEMPLGPYLVIAIVFVLLYGDPIIQWYVTSFFH